MKQYLEKAKRDFELSAEEAEKDYPSQPQAKEAYGACAQRVGAILDRILEEEASAKLNDTENILERANDLIHGERLKHYGHPSINFQRIAVAWTQYLSSKLKVVQVSQHMQAEEQSEQVYTEEISQIDVCVMMILLKSMRMSEGFHEDTIIDIAGYAALGAILAGVDEL